MKKIDLGNTGMQAPVVAVGCMGLSKLDRPGAERFINTAIENGANFFDHADIYGGGKCEELFAEAFNTVSAREKIILQSKCGIRRGQYDFSAEYILSSVDGILKRLNTDYLDVLLLHRPDALMEPEEVAEAFDVLYNNGKVRHFGVSNHSGYQIELLKKYVERPISVNQLQFGIAHAQMVSSGINVNTNLDFAIDRDGGVLDYCRLNGITIQPWSPFRYGLFEGIFIDSPKYEALNKKLNEIGERYGASGATAAFAWILRHPAKMQPITGTTKTERLLDCIKAAEITLTRGEWYEIYLSAGYTLP